MRKMTSSLLCAVLWGTCGSAMYFSSLILCCGFFMGQVNASSAFRPIHSLFTQQHMTSSTLSQHLYIKQKNARICASSSDGCSQSLAQEDSSGLIELPLPALHMRGGEALTKDTQTPWSKIQTLFLDILPATRVHFSLILLTTAVHLLGLPAPALFSLDLFQTFAQLQLWRPLTAMAYLGPPSMLWANHLYFLLKFGQALERSTGTATHVWFMLVQTFILSVLGILFNFPLQARAMLASIVYAWSRLNPQLPMNFQFGVQISAWQLPFCLAAIDCLSQQTISAAWPHALGLLSAHLFHFSRDILPRLTASSSSSAPPLLSRLFQTPQWLLKKFPPSNSNIAMDFRSDHVTSKDSISSSKKKKKTGNVLGSLL